MAASTRRAAPTGLAQSFQISRTLSERIQISSPERRQTFRHWSSGIDEPKGPLDFERFPFQKELYDVFGDTSVKDVVVMKGTQVGVSALLAHWVLWIADVGALNALYVFPARRQMYDFFDSRIRPLLEQPYLAGRTRDGSVQNKGLRSVGDGLVFFRGSDSKNDLISIDADALALDEYDQLHPGNVPDAERRVSGSELALIRRAGVPSDPGYGIAKRFAESDQRHWWVECAACGEQQTPTFERNVRWNVEAGGAIVNARLVCARCEQGIDVRVGEWIARFPSRSLPGFHVNRLLVPHADLAPIVRASLQLRPHQRASFLNNDLGLPYADEVAGLDTSAIDAAIAAATKLYGAPLRQRPGYHGDNPVTMGVDVASTRSLHVRISEHIDPIEQEGRRKVGLFIGTAVDFSEVAQLIRRFRVDLCVIDQLPEMRLSLGLAECYPGQVYVCHYTGEGSEAIALDPDEWKVGVNRTLAMDATASLIREQRNLLPADLPDDFVQHMLAPRRRLEHDEFDRRTTRYRSTGNDDFYMAETYDIVATEVLRIRWESLRQQQPHVINLAEELGIEPSPVSDYEDMTYRPGPGEHDDGMWGIDE
jgi:hypothetical protein